MKLGRASAILLLTTVLLAGCRSAERDWKVAKNANSAAAYADFLARHPSGKHADEAAQALESLDWSRAVSTGNPKAFFDFYRAHPTSSRISVGRGRIESWRDVVFSSSTLHSGSAWSEYEVSLDGIQIPMGSGDACRVGILDCGSDSEGRPFEHTRPPSLALVVMEREKERILAVDFAGVGSETPADEIEGSAVSGDFGKMQSLLKGDPNLVSSKDVAGWTPLLLAANSGKKEVAELLLANHADVNAKDNFGEPPLHYAILSHHKDIADLLRTHGGVSEYVVPEEARSRHILVQVAQGADAKTDAVAKAKADALLKQIQGGADFASLAAKNSDDPGSKDSGGELGFVQRGTMVPEFDDAVFTQPIGEITIVKSKFGYHILQVEERTAAHTAEE
jgi:parvulin-like peptidyl-prolyl isomerase